jgi:site-specific recombinase XerD
MVGRVVPLTSSGQTLAAAAAAFLAQPSLARSTRRSYDQTLTRLVTDLGGDRPLSTLTVEAVTVAVTTAWGGRAPATWNRQVATVRSFLGFCRRRHWLVDDLSLDLERRPEPADRTKAIPLPELERLWRREDVGVREKALWRLLYETAARAVGLPRLAVLVRLLPFRLLAAELEGARWTRSRWWRSPYRVGRQCWPGYMPPTRSQPVRGMLACASSCPLLG